MSFLEKKKRERRERERRRERDGERDGERRRGPAPFTSVLALSGADLLSQAFAFSFNLLLSSFFPSFFIVLWTDEHTR